MPPKKVRLGRPKKQTTAYVTVPEISDTEIDSDLISSVISNTETECVSEDSDPKKKTKNVFSAVKRVIVKGIRGVLQNNSNEEQLSPLFSKKAAKQQISAASKRKEPSSSDPECLNLKKMHISSRFAKQPVVKQSTILKSDSVSTSYPFVLPVNNKRKSQRIVASNNKKRPQDSNVKNASLPHTSNAVPAGVATTAVIFSFLIFPNFFGIIL